MVKDASIRTGCFDYDDLPLANGAATLIRTLKLSSGQPGAPLEGELGVVDLKNEPPYEALSYVWGDRSNPKEILLSGRRLTITNNLASALQHIRQTDEDRVLWVDAVCINQVNIPERNQQVSIMASIYRRAICVLIYVGERTAESDIALDMTGRLGKLCSTSDNQLRPAQTYSLQEYEEFLADARRLGSFTEEEWAALQRFYLERPYFTRGWVVQEVALARQASLICGDRSLPWAWIENMQTIYEDMWPFMSTIVRRLNEVFAVAWSMNRKTKPANPWIRREHQPRLEHYLWRFAANRCSDAHDFVYAYLGLVDLEAGSIQVDYAKTKRELYIKATGAMIIESQDLLPLCMTRRSGKPLSQDLPSWVPDWSDPITCDQLVEGDEDVQLFYADGRGIKVTDVTTTLLLGDNWNTIFISGGIVDTIHSVCAPIDSSMVDWEGHVKAWIPKELCSCPYVHLDGREDDAVEAFWWTLLKYTNRGHYKESRPGRRWHPKHYRYLFLQWAGLPVSAADEESARKEIKNTKKDDEYNIWAEKSFSECLGNRGNSLYGWTLATTSKSLWAMVPFDTKQGDTVIVARGSSVPFVLRPLDAGHEPHYTLVGTAYVYGIMFKEFMTMMEQGYTSERVFGIH